jgi:hypothetical protein
MDDDALDRADLSIYAPVFFSTLFFPISFFFQFYFFFFFLAFHVEKLNKTRNQIDFQCHFWVFHKRDNNDDNEKYISIIKTYNPLKQLLCIFVLQ